MPLLAYKLQQVFLPKLPDHITVPSCNLSIPPRFMVDGLYPPPLHGIVCSQSFYVSLDHAHIAGTHKLRVTMRSILLKFLTGISAGGVESYISYLLLCNKIAPNLAA